MIFYLLVTSFAVKKNVKLGVCISILQCPELKGLFHMQKFDVAIHCCFIDRSQVGFGFVFMVSDSDSQFRIRKSNTKLENLKVILRYFKENRLL